MRTATIFAFALFAFSALAGVPEKGVAEVISKETTGEAAIVDGDRERATREARDRALRDAVEQVAGVLVTSSSMTQNSQLINDQVFAHSAGYVRSYEVTHKAEDHGVMKVSVKAQVGTQKLEQDLLAVQALIKRLQARKLVVLVSEHTVDEKGNANSGGNVSAVLTEQFRKDGWTMIDPSFAAGKVRVQAVSSLNAPEAKEIGNLLKADYILYGTAAFRDVPASGMLQGSGAKVFFINGDYDLAVFETGTGTQLVKIAGNVSNNLQSASVISREDSVHKLVGARAPEIVGKVRTTVVESLRSSEQNGSRMVLSVNGLADFASFQAFKKELSRWSAGVRDSERGSLDKGRGDFSVTFLGTAESLAESIDGKKFQTRKVSVTGVGNNTLEITIAK